MNNTMQRLSAFVPLAALAMTLAACGPSAPKMRKFDISLSPQATQKVEVDLVAVPNNPGDLATWRTKNLDDYFSGNDKLRSGNAEFTRSFTFNEGANNKIVINKKDEIWNKWFDKRPMLFVLANSRSLRAEAQKGQEVRRTEVPLTSDYWKQDSFEIIVKDGIVQINPPPTLIAK